ncbi:hypothetical protein RRSWK_06738 [Rhodopirellula sp. SWK7]|nr:hypothetical protein RRSWK_06738 [Rhodopirellula sp. SWK7]
MERHAAAGLSALWLAGTPKRESDDADFSGATNACSGKIEAFFLTRVTSRVVDLCGDAFPTEGY